MIVLDPRIDKYIDKSQDFAKPILLHIRILVHNACPDIKETMKWSFPHFEYQKSILCSMASFKQHCAFGFWLGDFLTDRHNVLEKVGNTAMGNFGKIKSLSDLPSDVIILELISEAMLLIEQGVKVPKPPQKELTEIEIPIFFAEALSQDSNAFNTFNALSPSQQREYILWLTEAKTEKTRLSRLDTSIEWLSEGKNRNWKYEKNSK